MNYPKAKSIEETIPRQRKYISIPQYKDHVIVVVKSEFSLSFPEVGVDSLAAIVGGVILGGLLFCIVEQNKKRRRR